MRHCAILENTAANYVFYGTFYAIDCTIDSNQLSTTYGTFSKTLNQITSFTNVLQSIDCSFIYKETIPISNKNNYKNNVNYRKKSKIYY